MRGDENVGDRAIRTADRFLIMYGPIIILLGFGGMIAAGAFALSAQSESLEERHIEILFADFELARRQALVLALEEKLQNMTTKLKGREAELLSTEVRLLTSEVSLVARQAENAILWGNVVQLKGDVRELDQEIAVLKQTLGDNQAIAYYQKLLEGGVARAKAIWELGRGERVGPVTPLCSVDPQYVAILRSRVPLVLSAVPHVYRERLSDAVAGLCSGTGRFGPNWPARVLREIALDLAETNTMIEAYADWCPRHPNITFSTGDLDGARAYEHCRRTLSRWLKTEKLVASQRRQLASSYVAALRSDAGLQKTSLYDSKQRPVVRVIDAAVQRLQGLAEQSGDCVAQAEVRAECVRVLGNTARQRFGFYKSPRQRELACFSAKLSLVDDPGCVGEVCMDLTRLCESEAP